MKNLFRTILIILIILPMSCGKEEDSSDSEILKSDEKSIISFSFEKANNSVLDSSLFAVVNENEGTITINAPNGLDVSELVPTIEISEFASINPTGVQNFNSDVTYTVTAEDSTTKDYIAKFLYEEITIDSMEPTNGPKNTIVTFTGDNFGTNIENIQVFFDDIEAEVQQVNQTSITTVLPPKAYSGIVKIIIGEQEFDGFVFDYEISDVNVSIITGSIDSGFVNGSASIAQFSRPNDITVGVDGNLYVSDTGNNSVRKVTYEFIDNLLAGISVTTLAGNGNYGFANGSGQDAQFDAPVGITSDSNGNIYVADLFNNSIRAITPSGEVTTLLDLNSSELIPVLGQNFSFNPDGLAIDDEDNLYITERSSHSILKVAFSGEISRIAGDGTSGYVDGNGTSAKFSYPKDIAVDSNGNLYVTDNGNNVIRKISTSGDVSTFAGSTVSGFSNGSGAIASFNYPQGITIDSQDNLYVVDVGNHSIRKIDMLGSVTTLAGNGISGFTSGIGSQAMFNQPRGISIDTNGNLYVTDSGNNSIRLITQE
ncbi:IPT/TIG domain-containing protein [Maribacter stanieri]|uniref:NHL domain-containing protein n=1 Tax=Maribacter stanieri TaxID=440514 RepID=UPI002494C441|nr:IPT/TIG domain-containing protein [Maribacter stanieri]|tara:strand:- start:43 stop:1662 length:1620 start_codon:yes stop_codon:yes gene_type:complete